jgi:hypothetical protein
MVAELSAVSADSEIVLKYNKITYWDYFTRRVLKFLLKNGDCRSRKLLPPVRRKTQQKRKRSALLPKKTPPGLRGAGPVKKKLPDGV